MTAYIAQVIRAGAPYQKGFWIVILLNINLVKGGIAVISHAEGNGINKIIMLHQLNIPGSMDLFAPAYDFISAGIIDIFD